MFPCIKTILGDIGQDVSGSKSNLLNEFNSLDDRNSEVITLNKSYRSTYEIASFANNIINRQNVEIVNRHGSPVQIVKYATVEQKINYIKKCLEQFKANNYKSIGILTKSIHQEVPKHIAKTKQNTKRQDRIQSPNNRFNTIWRRCYFGSNVFS